MDEDHHITKPVDVSWRPWHGEEKNLIWANAVMKVIPDESNQ